MLLWILDCVKCTLNLELQDYGACIMFCFEFGFTSQEASRESQGSPRELQNFSVQGGCKCPPGLLRLPLPMASQHKAAEGCTRLHTRLVKPVSASKGLTRPYMALQRQSCSLQFHLDWFAASFYHYSSPITSHT